MSQHPSHQTSHLSSGHRSGHRAEVLGGPDRRTLLLGLGAVGVGLALPTSLGSALEGVLPGAEAASSGAWSNPTLGTLTSGYKSASRPSHAGWDVANDQGTPVYAAAAGVVRDIRTGSYPGDKRPGPLAGRTGNSIHVDHADRWFTYYGHLYAVLVSDGQRVSCGQLIGLMGTTGVSTGNHLHFEVHRPRLSTLNPLHHLRARGISLGATTPVGSTGWPTLRRGASGFRVRTLQYLVRSWRVTVPVSGSFDAATLSGVKAYQRTRKLVADGVAGPWSWAAAALTLRSGSSGDQVRALQTALNGHGARLLVDGGFGSVTVAAVKKFQSAKKLVADGEVGPRTWTALL